MTDLELPHFFLPRTSQRPSGLWVASDGPISTLPDIPTGTLLVVGKPPSDLDAIFVAPEAEVLGIPPVSIGTVEDLLGRLPFEPAMMALAVIGGATWFAGNDQSKHLRLAEDVFGTGRPIFDKLTEFVAEGPNHLIFNEQHISVLMRLLITGSASAEDGMRELTDEEVELLLMALVGIATPISAAGNEVADPAEPIDWVPFLVRSGLYFDKTNLGSDQGRAHALFVDLFGAADPMGTDGATSPAGWGRISPPCRSSLGSRSRWAPGARVSTRTRRWWNERLRSSRTPCLPSSCPRRRPRSLSPRSAPVVPTSPSTSARVATASTT